VVQLVELHVGRVRQSVGDVVRELGDGARIRSAAQHQHRDLDLRQQMPRRMAAVHLVGHRLELGSALQVDLPVVALGKPVPHVRVERSGREGIERRFGGEVGECGLVGIERVAASPRGRHELARALLCEEVGREDDGFVDDEPGEQVGPAVRGHQQHAPPIECPNAGSGAGRVSATASTSSVYRRQSTPTFGGCAVSPWPR
jgi:hypothetical protein